MLELGLQVDIDFLSKKYNTPFTATKFQPEPPKTPDVPKPKNTKINKNSKKIYKAPDLGYPPAKLSFWKKIAKNLRKILLKNNLDDVEKLLNLPEKEATEKLFEHYKNTFLKAIDKGFKNPDFGSAEGFRYVQMQENAYKFAYAKAKYVWQVIHNAADDRKTSIYKQMHENYTVAEANHFTASSRMAKKWFTIQKEKNEFPYLQYVTAHDDHVRPAHKALDGIIRPVDNPFWQTHYPPNGYNCRCTVKKLSEIPATYQDPNTQPPTDSSLFNNNPGITGVAFNEEHAYLIDWGDKESNQLKKIIRDDVKTISLKNFNRYSDENLTLFINSAPCSISATNSDVKTFLSELKQINEYNIKNLLLCFIDKIINNKNILEIWEAEPDADEIDNMLKIYYIKTSVLPEWYFVFKLRKISKKLTIYSITKFSWFMAKQENRKPKKIYPEQ